MTAVFEQFLRNPLCLDSHGIWRLEDAETISYSDGAAVEHYLQRVLQSANDLSSTSTELIAYVRNWPTEYHLSRARSLLLRGFRLSPTCRVLEIGSGAGAITRYLGETCGSVVAVEGSLARARLTRTRCRDLANVDVLCAPFDRLEFEGGFDLVVCVGVLEYAARFGTSTDPYRHLLTRMRSALNERGSLILAIENQFGLKYFAGLSEDHTGTAYEGIEGYPRRGHTVRTFGRRALEQRLREQFSRVDFYYPYPDYKLPRVVVSERAHQRLDLGELVGSYTSRDYATARPLAFSERLASMDLAENGMLSDLSHSFLAVCGNAEEAIEFPQLGVIFSLRPNPRFNAVTRIVERDDGGIITHKTPTCTDPDGPRLSLRKEQCAWRSGLSVHTQILRNTLRKGNSLSDSFAPARTWLRTLESVRSAAPDGKLPGSYFDAIWKNAFLDNDTCVFIDLEWQYHAPLSLRALVARACDCFLTDLEDTEIPQELRGHSRWNQIQTIARTVGVSLDREDLVALARLEAVRKQEVSDSSRPGEMTMQLMRLTIPGAFRKVGRSIRRSAANGRRLLFEAQIRGRHASDQLALSLSRRKNK